MVLPPNLVERFMIESDNKFPALIACPSTHKITLLLSWPIKSESNHYSQDSIKVALVYQLSAITTARRTWLRLSQDTAISIFESLSSSEDLEKSMSKGWKVLLKLRSSTYISPTVRMTCPWVNLFSQWSYCLEAKGIFFPRRVTSVSSMIRTLLYRFDSSRGSSMSLLNRESTILLSALQKPSWDCRKRVSVVCATW